MVTIILVLQCCLCIWFVGTVLQQTLQVQEKVVQFQQNVAEKNYYDLIETLDDAAFYKYMSDQHYKYKEMCQFYQELLDKKELDYTVLCEQEVFVSNVTIPEMCLSGYEDGMVEEDIEENGRKISGVKCYQVSQNIFSKFHIEMEQGEKLSEKDYTYKEGRPVSVILGSAYKQQFKIGDKIEVEYLYKMITLQVKGFLKEGEYYSDGQKTKVLDRYMLIPMFDFNENQPTEFNKMRLLQALGGFFITNQEVETVEKEVERLLEKNHAPKGKKGIWLQDSNKSSDVSQLGQISSMTQEVRKQYITLLIVLTLFVIGSLSVAINGFVRENHYEYGVQLLNGASSSDLVVNVCGIVSFIVLIGDIGAMLLLSLSQSITAQVGWLLQLLVLVVMGLACIVPVLHVKKVEVSDLIGGKE